MGIFISNTLCSRPKVTTWKGNIVLRHYAQLQRHLFNCFLQKCIISLYILIIWGLLVPDRSGLFRILVPPLFTSWMTINFSGQAGENGTSYQNHSNHSTKSSNVYWNIYCQLIKNILQNVRLISNHRKLFILNLKQYISRCHYLYSVVRNQPVW